MTEENHFADVSQEPLHLPQGQRQRTSLSHFVLAITSTRRAADPSREPKKSEPCRTCVTHTLAMEARVATVSKIATMTLNALQTAQGEQQESDEQQDIEGRGKKLKAF